jgi:hypothetical protein
MPLYALPPTTDHEGDARYGSMAGKHRARSPREWLRVAVGSAAPVVGSGPSAARPGVMTVKEPDEGRFADQSGSPGVVRIRAAGKWAAGILLAGLGAGIWRYLATQDIDLAVEVGATVVLVGLFSLGVVGLAIAVIVVIAWTAEKWYPRRVAGVLVAGVSVALLPLAWMWQAAGAEFNRNAVPTTAYILSLHDCLETSGKGVPGPPFYLPGGRTCDVDLVFQTTAGRTVYVTHEGIDPEASFEFIGGRIEDSPPDGPAPAVEFFYDQRDPTQTAARLPGAERTAAVALLGAGVALGAGLLMWDVWWTRRRKERQAAARDTEGRVEADLEQYVQGRGDTTTGAIIVRRPNSQTQWTRDESRPYHIEVDGVVHDWLKPAEATVLELPPATYVVQARIEWSRESPKLTVPLTGGATVHVRVEPTTDAPPEYRSHTRYGPRHLALYVEPARSQLEDRTDPASAQPAPRASAHADDALTERLRP